MLLLDKAAGHSSFGAIAALRPVLGRKLGHAGTLDPFASGLLIVLLGRAATRQQRVFMELPKLYRTTTRFGAVSSTGDRDGEITETGKVPEAELELPLGEIRQTTPAYSAVRVGGVRSHRLARAGVEFTPPPRIVTVYRFEELWRRGEEAEFEIECSSGTYVRSLVAALGDAYCLDLRRLAIGPFVVEDADTDEPLPLLEALKRLEASGSGRVRRR